MFKPPVLRISETFMLMWSLLLSVTLLLLATGLFGTFISLRAIAEGFSQTTAGLLMSAYYAGFIAGSLYATTLINQVGHIRAFAAFCAVTGASISSFAFMADPVLWVVLRAIVGFNMAGLFMVVESWLNAKANNTNRGTLLALYMLTSYVALGVGQLLINLGSDKGIELFVLTSLLLSLAVVPVAITRASYPDPVDSSHFGLLQLYAISPLAVFGCLTAGLLTGAAQGMGAIYAMQKNFNTSEIALFMSVLISSGLLLQFPLGKLSDYIDRRIIIAFASVAVVVCSWAMIHWEASSLVHLLLITMLFGGFLATLYPLSIAYANDNLQPSEFIPASSGLLLTFGIGGMLGSFSVAWVMKWVGANGLFIFTGVVSFVLTLLVLYRLPLRRSVPSEQKEAFVAMPEMGVTPTILDTDPRAEGAQEVLPLAASEVTEGQTTKHD